MSRARSVADFIPPLGALGTVLTKSSLNSYDTEWAAGSGGLPPIAVTDAGTALVVDPTGLTAGWGNIINSNNQTIDSGSFP